MIAVSTSAIEISPTGIFFLEEVDFTTWSEFGKRIGEGMNSVAWCVGDWLNYGERSFSGKIAGEAYDAAIAATGLERETLHSYACVARAFPHAERDAGMSFSHHRELLSIPAKKRDEWRGLLATPQAAEVFTAFTARKVPLKQLRASIRACGDGPARIISKEEYLTKKQPMRGTRTCEFALMEFTAFVREMLPHMDADQRSTFKTLMQGKIAKLMGEI